MREKEKLYKALSSRIGDKMKETNYNRELYKARLEAEELFRRKQIELIQEQILSGDDDPSWISKLVGAMKCAERISRKLDQMADEDSMEMEDKNND